MNNIDMIMAKYLIKEDADIPNKWKPMFADYDSATENSMKSIRSLLEKKWLQKD